MNIISALLISFGASLDACAVSICKGFEEKEFIIKKAVNIGIWFGTFQALMPFFGFAIGIYFDSLIYQVDHWISFILLLYIGIDMMKNAKKEEDTKSSIFMLALATSIDAFSIGVAYACGYGYVNAYFTFLLIGIITFMMSFLGFKAGSMCGNNLGWKAKVLGGVILILIGLKILLEHLI